VLVGRGEGDWQTVGHGEAGATQILREVVPLGNTGGTPSRQRPEPYSDLLICSPGRSENVLFLKFKESQKLGIDAGGMTKAVRILGRQGIAFN